MGCLLFASPVSAEKAEEMDLVRLKTGMVIEGCIVEQNESHITMETSGGTFIVPSAKMESVVRSRPGESALLLGQQLLTQQNFVRANRFLTIAQQYSAWKSQAALALSELEQLTKRKEEQNRARDQEKIETIIRHRGLQAGIEALRNQAKSQDDYWGSYRGRLHLLMAQNRIDHLDLSKAEQHLALAEQYGVDQAQWEKVRQDLLAMKKKSILFGKRELAQMLQPQLKPKPTAPLGSSNFLDRITTARKNGESMPPLTWLQCVDQHARLNDLDPLLVWAIIDTESAWQPKAISKVGAQGLMQLMPGTAKDLNVDDPFNPEENIRGGTEYMRFLLQMFNDDLDTALAAYNVGPGTVERANGIPAAGQRYINKVRTRLSVLRKRFGIS